jgi:hypothetical protein
MSDMDTTPREVVLAIEMDVVDKLVVVESTEGSDEDSRGSQSYLDDQDSRVVEAEGCVSLTVKDAGFIDEKSFEALPMFDPLADAVDTSGGFDAFDVDNAEVYVPCFPLLYKLWMRRNRNKTGTLKEKLTMMKEGTLQESSKKISDRLSKFERLLEEDETKKKHMNDIIRFYYSTDLTFARDSSEDAMIFGIKRRAAWAQDPLRLTAVTVAQIAICLVVILSHNEPVNGSTVFMAILYLMAYSTTIKFTVTSELFSLLGQYNQSFLKAHQGQELLLIGHRVGGLLLSPVLLLPLSITYLIDITVGKLTNLSYAEIINVAVDFMVMFTGFSVGLRSGNPINAVQTFAAFDAIRGLDEIIIENYDPSLESLVSHGDSKGKQRKMLVVRIAVYLTIPILLILFVSITVTNKCFAFCSDA